MEKGAVKHTDYWISWWIYTTHTRTRRSVNQFQVIITEVNQYDLITESAFENGDKMALKPDLLAFMLKKEIKKKINKQVADNENLTREIKQSNDAWDGWMLGLSVGRLPVWFYFEGSITF